MSLPPKSQREGRVTRGLETPCLLIRLVLDRRQAGRKEPRGLGHTRKGKLRAGSRNPSAWPALRFSLPAINPGVLQPASPGPYFLPWGVGGRWGSGSLLEDCYDFKGKRSCFWCLPRDRARSQGAAFVVPVKGAVLTRNSWTGLISLKTSCQTKWETEFSREVCVRSPPPSRLGSDSKQHTTWILGPKSQDQGIVLTSPRVTGHAVCSPHELFPSRISLCPWPVTSQTACSLVKEKNARQRDDWK